MSYILIVLGAYLFGSVPFGLLIGFLFKKDIRKEGSGNIGATNVTRVIGKTAGRVCFALDFVKGALPVLAADRWFAGGDGSGAVLLLAGGAAIAGHMFPVYLHFKGGKGVSTAGGVALAMAPAAFLAAGITWVAVFLFSRYVSLASIVAALVLPLTATAMYAGGCRVSLFVVFFFYFVAAAAVWKHRTNIGRLRAGTEMRFARKDRKG